MFSVVTFLSQAEVTGAWEVVGGDGVHEWWPQLNVFCETESGVVWEVWTRGKRRGSGTWRFDSMDEVIFFESDGSFATRRGHRFALVREEGQVWLRSLATTAGSRRLRKVELPEECLGGRSK